MKQTLIRPLLRVIHPLLGSFKRPKFWYLGLFKRVIYAEYDKGPWIYFQILLEEGLENLTLATTFHQSERRSHYGS